MPTIKNARDFEKELTRIYDRFNRHFWNNELPEVIITFHATKSAHGHMADAPTWTSGSNRQKYELNISAYTIDRTPNEICAAILHEQCHLYDLLHGIKDTSNKGRYHNKRFKKTAEDHGLNVKNEETAGWCHTELDNEAKAYVKRLKIKRFEYHRDVRPSTNNGLKRYRCPGCGKTTVYASSTVFVICGHCGSFLVFDPRKKRNDSTSE